MSCPITWCTETGIHDHHQVTLGTWHGVSVPDESHGMTAQLVIHGDRRT